MALLPGSRSGEVHRLGYLFLDTAEWLALKRPGLKFVIPAASASLNQLLKRQIRSFQPDLPITLVEGRSRDVLGAADAALVASGTAALEAMLLKCPMAVAYKLSSLSYGIIRAFDLLKIPYVSLPNLLAERQLVPEFLQSQATPGRLGAAVLELLSDPKARATQVDGFAPLARRLRQGADERAAEAVLGLLESRRRSRG